MKSGFIALAVVAMLATLGACDKAGESGKAAEDANMSSTQLAAPPAEPPPPAAKILKGTDGNDTLEGGFGHDHLTGGPGADTLDGKEGFDYTRYDDATVGLVVNLGDPSQNTGDAKGDVFMSLQGIVGSAFDDTLTGNEETNDIHGMASNDTLRGLDGIDGLDGEEGDDSEDGGPGKDVYVGGPGNDTFIFHSGEADGDAINDFEGAGSGPGDKIMLVNFGKGATFTKGDENNWVVKSADGLVVETIKVTGGTAMVPGDYVFQ